MANRHQILYNESANTLLLEFLGDFLSATNVNNCVTAHCLDESSFKPYCTELKVAEALHNCSPSNASHDGIFYKVLKAIAPCILTTLNIIFQQSLCKGKFPTQWKHAIVMPLSKDVATILNRPISLYLCLGKLPESVM